MDRHVLINSATEEAVRRGKEQTMCVSKNVMEKEDIDNMNAKIGLYFCKNMPCGPDDCGNVPCRYLEQAIRNRTNEIKE